MNLPLLPFNKTLLKKDWQMTKWLPYVVLGILFSTLTLGIINTYSDYQQTLARMAENPQFFSGFDAAAYKDTIRANIEYSLTALGMGEIGIIVLMPMLIAALLFGEEKRCKTLELLATMPFGRWEVFFNKALIALLNIIFPFAANALILIIALGFSSGLREFYTAGMVVAWLGTNGFRLFIILAFSLLFAALTGNTISQLVLTFIFFIFPIGFAGLLEMNMMLWGYDTMLTAKFLDNFARYTLPGTLGWLGDVPLAYHLAWAAVMLIAAKLLFDRNKLERSGETLEFESLETFFKAGVSVCISLLAGVIFYGIAERLNLSLVSNEMYIILGYIAGLFGGWYIASYSIKTSRVKL